MLALRRGLPDDWVTRSGWLPSQIQAGGEEVLHHQQERGPPSLPKPLTLVLDILRGAGGMTLKVLEGEGDGGPRVGQRAPEGSQQEATKLPGGAGEGPQHPCCPLQPLRSP